MRLYLKYLAMAALAAVSMGCKSQPASIASADNSNTLLWEVSGNGLARPSFILGTMHILCAQDANLSPQLRQVLDATGQVYLEIDMDDLGQMFGSLKAMAMRNGTKLSDLLSPEEYQRVEKFFGQKSPLPFSMMERYKPMLLSAMVVEQQLPCEKANGMEIMLMAEATTRKQEIKGLETMEFQVGLFDSIPYAVQAKELLKAIDSMGQDKGSIDSLLLAYRQQDLAMIEKVSMMDDGAVGGNLDLLLYSRNRNWAAQVGPIAQKMPTLFAVGAAHLPGSQGLLELLRKQGYTLRPLKNETTVKTTSL
ncbi:MAG: TraB/GumN family protein [Chitinophagaceae bacterium]|nr:TraB/GumN family protein [Chitinophagaceae bacterium]